MIGVLLVTHGSIGESLLKAAKNIVGAIEGVEALAFHPGEGPLDLRERLVEAIARLDDGNGVLLLVDIMGGTPGNVALTLIDECRVEILAGVNLPMVISLMTGRQSNDLKALAGKIREKGLSSITDLKEEWRRYHESCAD